MELNTVKVDEIPYQAHQLFIKLYCKRKAEHTKKTVQDAQKAWIKLNHSEKAQFYKTSAERKFLKYAHSLSKTETYLKGKFSRKHNNLLDEPQRNKDQKEKVEPHNIAVSISEDNATENESELSIEDRVETNRIDNVNQNNTNFEVTSVLQLQSDQENNQDANDESFLCQPTPSMENNETKLEETVEILNNTNSNLESLAIDVPLIAPEPPKIKDAQELYEMIKKPGDIDWKSLTRREKAHYRFAVVKLKKAYINSYKQYLESLSQQQLFDHYKKTLYYTTH